MLNKTLILLFSKVLSLSLLITANAMASNTDHNQPMQIEAGKVILKEKQGISRYIGNVKITQGSRFILGDNITIHSNNGDVTKVIVKGQPASFSQLNDENEKVNASAHQMTFYTKTDILVLEENAILQQKDNVFKSEKISYNTAKDIITAGKHNGSTDERVKITIHPKKDNSEDNTKDGTLIQ